MLSKIGIRKITVTSAALFVIGLIYLFPTKDLKIEKNINYIDEEKLSQIYMLDNNNYVSEVLHEINADTLIDKLRCKLESITNSEENKIKNFKGLIPANTKVLSIDVKDKVCTVDFSKELLGVSALVEEKMIESIVYTLTSIKGIDKIKIQVDSSPLTKLPNSKEQLPEELDKNYGINKTYDLVTTNNIISYTTYYVNKYNNNEYYVPVTKYINNKDNDIIKIIIKELSSSPIYETNLMSYLNAGAVLEDYELLDNNLKLNFNELLLNDINKKNLLEEVIYTISLSMDNYYNNLETVSFYINNEEVYTVNINDIK